MAYVDFPDGLKGQKQRKAFWLSEEGLTLIRGWRRQGIPITRIVDDYIGIGRTAFFAHWVKESDALQKALATSKDIANQSVEEALLKRALGYDYYDERYEMVEGDLQLVGQNKHHVPPDVKAILSWLFNRLPNRWRAVQEPLEATQYVDTIKNILVAMKEVAETGDKKVVEAETGQEEE